MTTLNTASSIDSVLGVFIDGNHIQAGRVTNGKIYASSSCRIDQQDLSDGEIKKLLDCISIIINKNVIGIGITAPGIIDNEKGLIIDDGGAGHFNGIALVDILRREFGRPVYISNDANCFVLAEKYFGKAKNNDNMIGLIIDEGVEAGIIVNGKLIFGNTGSSGDCGDIPYKDGMFEDYTSKKFFESHYEIDYKDCLQLATLRDKQALQIFKDYGFHLGKLIHILIIMHDPQVIVLGGDISKAYKYFKKSLTHYLKSNLSQSIGYNYIIDVSKQKNVQVLGAAALHYDYQLRYIEQSAEKQLKIENNRRKGLLNILPYPVITLNPGGRIMSANRAVRTILGRTDNYLLRKKISDFYYTDTENEKGKENDLIRFITKEGQILLFTKETARVLDEDENIIEVQVALKPYLPSS